MTTPISNPRRDFLKQSASLGGALCLSFFIAPSGRQAIAAEAETTAPTIPTPNAFLRIDEDDTVTIVSNKSEMGQGIYTSLAMLLAEELECDWNRIKVVAAPLGKIYGHALFHIQITGGSTSTVTTYDEYRKIGAAAREMLIAAAASIWQVPTSSCRAENGQVIHPATGRGLRYGQLTKAANALPVPSQVTLKPRKDFKLVGKPQHRIDNQEKINGQAQFSLDVRLPDMLTAVVKRCPAYGGTPRKIDDSQAKTVPGVKAIVPISNGVAIIATGFWPAKKARDLLTVEWNMGPNAKLDSKVLFKQYRTLTAKPGTVFRQTGQAEQALKSASKQIEATYELPFLAHAPMEPLNCVVHLKPDGCEIWSGTQSQTMDAGLAANVAGLKPEQIMLHTTYLGGGFGRRAVPGGADWLKEAVEIAKVSGLSVPIKLMWTRDDDLAGTYYRPMWVSRVRGGIDAKGQPIAWLQTGIGQSIAAGTPFEQFLVKHGVDELSVEGANDMPYAVPNILMDQHTPQFPIPVLWWRSVGHSHTAFVKECFIDELCHLARKDPVQYRMGLLAGAPREMAVLAKAAEISGWGKAGGKKRAMGVAVHKSFDSYVAQVVEVTLKGRKLKVDKVYCAVDCGTTVNPDQIRAQVESSVIFGLSAALHGEISFKQGSVVQRNFDGYPVVRMYEAPKIEVAILPSDLAPSGIGEPATPPVAAALCNAIFAASGKRIRSLPLGKQGFETI
ncbi:xanthine dehydrogenase family protein molybdopterin-binding subunit [Chitinivorax sp. B]|uniref:xanthine dehydrogenase family protein molybdopterin-binding subunit n=1 Tax=Chitinivorax sp. B TaxID=2502235 RepID=UPI0010F60C2D|nr:xanthine dehydrogenase family protein molybdopterin-binding subunit [Chitinivorax sp. B]